MKLRAKLILAGIIIALSSGLHAHTGHKHKKKKPVTEEVAKQNARTNVEKLISQKKVDSSWSKAELISIEKKKFGKKYEWVVTYFNKDIKDETKKRLYIFMKLSGEYIAANHTGK